MGAGCKCSLGKFMLAHKQLMSPAGEKIITELLIPSTVGTFSRKEAFKICQLCRNFQTFAHSEFDCSCCTPAERLRRRGCEVTKSTKPENFVPLNVIFGKNLQNLFPHSHYVIIIMCFILESSSSRLINTLALNA